jgi:uncharacterized protein (UPF0333 family)
MDAERKSLVATALVGLVVLSIIIGSIYYLIQFIRNRNTTNVANNQVTASASPTASGQVAVDVNHGNTHPVSGDYKTFNEGNFQVSYPKSWGILTCSNSSNIELDPTNGQDNLKIACSVASKPVTIIKDATGCTNGEVIDVGTFKVARTKATEGDYIRYEWCTKTVPALYITHRVSNDGSPATSKEDFSKLVEDMIAKLSFAQGS